MNKKMYEGMFLMDSGNPDFQAVSEPIRNILQRREAEVLALKPWEDRKLAFEIKGRKRGLYVLSYFKVDTQQLVEIEHDCALDERVLRSLILRRDELTEQIINADTPATTVPAAPIEMKPEGAVAAPTAEAAPAAEVVEIPEEIPAIDEIEAEGEEKA